MSVNYVKVGVDSPEVVQLASALGEDPKKIAAMLNQDAYRRAYNKRHNAEMKVLRQLVKDNPQLLKEVKS